MGDILCTAKKASVVFDEAMDKHSSLENLTDLASSLENLMDFADFASFS